MDSFKIILSKLQREVLITAPGSMEGHIKLSVPEFYGTTEGRPFAVRQVLHWKANGSTDKALFSLDRPPREVGINYHGHVAALQPGVLEFEGFVSNAQHTDIEDGHHTIHLDFTTTPALDDPDGSRTFVYTNTGWVSVQDLLAPVEEPPDSLWVGATYGERTIIWRTIARTSTDGDLTIALATNRGYALASNHPDWPKGLLGGCRWGTLLPEEQKKLRGRIYFFGQGLEELRQHYAHDFRYD